MCQLRPFHIACLQVALSADVLYYFVVDGFNGAAGTWAIDIEAMDNSTVAGQLISGTYALAEYSASGNSTNSESGCACCMLRAGQNDVQLGVRAHAAAANAAAE